MIVPELTKRPPSSHGRPSSSGFACLEFSPLACEHPSIAISTGLPALQNTPPYEIWLGDSAPLSAGQQGMWSYVHDKDTVFGWTGFPSQSRVEERTCQAYKTLLDALEALGVPHLVKVWHCVPDLCAEQDGLSRYRLFCRGRARALAQRLADERLCAATVIGTRAEQAVFYFIASRHPMLPIDNPCQTRAYQYPGESVEERPLFARASLVRTERYAHLHIAGTASIVGHESRHPGNPGKQTQVAMGHVLRLIEQAAQIDERFSARGKQPIRRMNFYCVKPEHQDIIRHCARGLLRRVQYPGFFCGDICRPELLVEMDALLVAESS